MTIIQDAPISFDPMFDPSELGNRSRRVPLIYAAMNRVQRQLGTFEKSGVGPSSQNSYPFLKVDDLVARLSPALIEHGVIAVPAITNIEQDVNKIPKVSMGGDPMPGAAPALQIHTRLRFELTFIAVEDGTSITAVTHGESIDTGDKGMRRAATAAYKELLLRTFTVVTGEDDPDAFAPQDTEDTAGVVKQPRGAQMMTKAAGRTRKAAAEPMPKVPAPEPEAPAEPVVEPEPAPAPAEPVREAQTPNEQRAADWQVDPEDVKHAEATAPKAAAPKAAEPVGAPAAEPVKSKADARGDDLQSLRKQIREAYTARGMTRDDANALGDKISGKQRAAWFANMTDLKKVLKSIEAGEVA